MGRNQPANQPTSYGSDVASWGLQVPPQRDAKSSRAAAGRLRGGSHSGGAGEMDGGDRQEQQELGATVSEVRPQRKNGPVVGLSQKKTKKSMELMVSRCF